MLRRSSLFLAIQVGSTLGLGCEFLTDPDTCIKSLPVRCNWLVLEGSCVSHDSGLALSSPPKCCSSLVAGTHCDHHVGDIPDGSCRMGFAVASNGPRFDLDYAIRMTHMASAAYCESDVATWSCGTHCDSVTGLSMIEYTYYKPANLAGFVAWDSVQNAIIVSFRGTQGSSVKNWWKNLDGITVKPYKDQYPNVKVHQGFHTSWEDLKPGIMASVAKIQAAHSSSTVYVTGHSLGAAIGAIAAFEMKVLSGLTVSLIDLGRPRTGNHDFAEAMMGELSSVFRMTHHDDPVPHALQEFLGFYHSGEEVFFQGDDTSYVSCDGSGEDDSCSNRCSPLFCEAIGDHLLYLGMPVGSDGCGSWATNATWV